MTIEEKAKAYDEALEKAKAHINSKGIGDTVDLCKHLFSELRESEDERIIRAIIDALYSHTNSINLLSSRGYQMENIETWLEKQEYDRMKPIYDARESFESALEKAWNDYHNGYENVDKLEDDYVECAHAKGFREGYLFGIEKQKEQKPAEKQDYSGLNDLERAIHRGFLCAGVENVPVTIIKDTAAECMGFLALIEPKPAKWSEEDEKRVKEAIKRIDELEFLGIRCNNVRKVLESIRPSWKPSEEQMKALGIAFRKDGDDNYRNAINSLYNDLKKL